MISDTLDSSEVCIAADHGVELSGLLTLPRPPLGVVVWMREACPASETGAFEMALVEQLSSAGFASLLFHRAGPRDAFEALPPRERIEAITDDLVAAIRWLPLDPETQPLNIGCIACGDAVVAALLAAARTPDFIDAIVSVRGLLQLAGEELDKVRAPTLFLAEPGQAPSEAVARIRVDKLVELLPREAFERELPRIACHWFERHLSTGHSFPAG